MTAADTSRTLATTATQGDQREALTRVLEAEFGSFLAHDPHDPGRFYGLAADAVMRHVARPSAPTVAQMTDVLVYHCRIGSRTCRECGDLPLGSSFAQHQAEQIAALGVTS